MQYELALGKRLKTLRNRHLAVSVYRCELLGLDALVVSELYTGSKFDFHFVEVNP